MSENKISQGATCAEATSTPKPLLLPILTLINFYDKANSTSCQTEFSVQSRGKLNENKNPKN